MKVYVNANPYMTHFITEGGLADTELLIGEHTRNQAEYIAVMRALQANFGTAEILSSNRLVVKQLSQEYNIEDKILKRLAAPILVWSGHKVKFTWVPRKDNPAGRGHK